MTRVCLVATTIALLSFPSAGFSQELVDGQVNDGVNEPRGVIEEPTPDDTSMPWVEWFQDANQATLCVRGLDYPGVEYWVGFQASFGPYVYTWEDGPYEAGALEIFYIDVEVPEAAFFHQGQLDYTTTLHATLWVVNPESGMRLQMIMAPVLFLGFEDDGLSVVYMSADEATSLAPLGVYSREEKDRLSNAGLDVESVTTIDGDAIVTGVSPVILTFDSDEDFETNGPVRE